MLTALTLILVPLAIELLSEDMRAAMWQLAQRFTRSESHASKARRHTRSSPTVLSSSSAVSTRPLPMSYSTANAWQSPASSTRRDLEAVRGRTLATLWVVVKLRRRNSEDLGVPRRLHRVTAATRSSSRFARLWMPMAVGASALTLEIPLLLLVSTHVEDGGATLTGLALALAIIIAIDAGPLALTTTSASSVARGWPHRAMWSYALAVGLASCVLLAVVWLDVLGNPLEIPAATWDAALDVLRGLMVAPLLVAVRRYFHGRLIQANKTGWVVWATVARAITSVLLAMLLSVLLDAGATGLGLAVTAGVAVEACVVAFGDGGRPDGAAARWRDVLKIAGVHLPLSGATLLAVLPAVAILGGLALSDGSDQDLAAWFVVFIGPSLIANLTLDIEAITATVPEEPAAGLLAFAMVLGVVLAGLWLGLATNAGIGDTVVAWLTPFPLLCVAREWLRGTLIGRDRAASTVPAVIAGSTALLVAFFAGRSAGLDPMSGIAAAITLGAAAETAVLGLASLGRASSDKTRARVERAGEPA